MVFVFRFRLYYLTPDHWQATMIYGQLQTRLEVTTIQSAGSRMRNFAISTFCDSSNLRSAVKDS